MPSKSPNFKSDLALAWNLGLRALKQKPWGLVGLGLLSAVPMDLLLAWKGFSVEVQYALQAAYAPIYLACQVILLAWLGAALGPGLKASPSWPKATLLFIASQVILAVKIMPLCLLGALPGLALVALANLKTLPGLLCGSLLVLAGLVPAFIYYYRRSLSPALILWQGAGPMRSLEQSRSLVAGRDWACLRLFLIFGLLANSAGSLPGLFQPKSGMNLAYGLADMACQPLALWLDTVWLAVLYQRLARES